MTRIGHLFEPLSGRAWSPEEIGRRLGERCASLRKLGLAAGDRVFLHHGNTLEFFVDLLAIWRLRACAVPLDSRLTMFELGALAECARPRISIWQEMPDGPVVRHLAGLGVTLVAKADESATGASIEEVPARPNFDDEAMILFTSGTTGNPKGVVHTHGSLRARWSSLVAALGVESYRRTLCFLPTHFGHGLICNCLFPWLNGCDLYVMPPFRANLLLNLGELIDRCAISALSSVPTVWRLVIKTARPPAGRSLNRVHCGSAPLSADLWQSIQSWAGTLNVINSYGITETGSWLAGTTTGFEAPRDGYIGPAWGGQIKVLQAADDDVSPTQGNICKAGDSGRVWVSTPALMKGYLGRDDLTSAAVKDGWFRTGDIGYVDDRGNLYLRGREREEINKGGMKVYPGDIDAVIELFPETVDVCTFAYPDALLDEDVGVAVVVTTPSDDTLIRLYDWTKDRLAKHQLPKRWYLLSEIPRTSRGKVDRAGIAKACSGTKPVDFARLRSR